MIILALIMLLLFWCWPSIWFVFVRDRLHVQVRLLAHAVEIGEAIELECEVTNRGWMPCPILIVHVQLPDGLCAYGSPDVHVLKLQTHLNGRQSVVIRGRVAGVARGLQSFVHHPVHVSLNEGFGLRSLAISREVADEVVVLPRYGVERASQLRMQALMGRLETFRWLNPDESLLRGVRPYTYGDAFKHIAMNASASTGEWMIKQYASSTDLDVVLVLNAQFHEQHWYSTDSKCLDEMASVLSSLARTLESRGFQLHFATNAVLPSLPGRLVHSGIHATAIRRLLGEMQAYANADFAELWQAVVYTAPPSAHVLLLSGFFTDEHLRLLDEGRIPSDRMQHIAFTPTVSSSPESAVSAS